MNNTMNSNEEEQRFSGALPHDLSAKNDLIEMSDRSIDQDPNHIVP